MSTIKGRLDRVVAQHARTSQLLGVDFVPVFRASPAKAADVPELETPKVAVEAEVKSVASPASGALSAIGGRSRADVEAAMNDLRARYERDAPHQHFKTDHHTIVWGDGDACARLMFVGEAPGEEEDRSGVPFVGRAGQLLNKMIMAMGLSRQTVYIANVLKTRPPNNATPTLEEARLCAPYLYEQIAIVRPEVLVTLGLPASRCLLNSDEAMGKLRGRWHTFTAPAVGGEPAFEVPVMPTYHPAFLLRAYTTENRAKVWSDLQMVMNKLGLQGKSPGSQMGE